MCAQPLSILPARLKVHGECEFFPLVEFPGHTHAEEPLALACTHFTMLASPHQLPSACTQPLLPLLLRRWSLVLASCWVHAQELLQVLVLSQMAPALSQPVAWCCCLGDGEREMCAPLFQWISGHPIPLKALGSAHTKFALWLYHQSHGLLQSDLTSFCKSGSFSGSWLLWSCDVSVLVLNVCTYHTDPLPSVEFLLVFSF